MENFAEEQTDKEKVEWLSLILPYKVALLTNESL